MEVVVEWYDETQTDVTSQAQRLQTENVDVIAAYTMPAQAGSLFKVCRETLSWDVPIVISGVETEGKLEKHRSWKKHATDRIGVLSKTAEPAREHTKPIM